jgi:acetolactate decarboxylase
MKKITFQLSSARAQMIFMLVMISAVTSCTSSNNQKDNALIIKDNVMTQEEKQIESLGSTIKVNDTDFSKGRLGLEHQLTLEDLEKFHGHLCDGLVVGFLGIKEGLDVLYPDGIVDRTNTRIVSKSSPCLTDVAVYVTGGRYQFNTFYVSNDITGFYVIQRIDNGKTISVTMNKGVKPAEIDELGAKAVSGELTACELDSLKQMEDNFSEKLLSTNPKDNFTVIELDSFEWNPILKNDFTKTDVLNKNKEKCNK